MRALYDVVAVAVVANAVCCDDGVLAKDAANGGEAAVEALETGGACAATCVEANPSPSESKWIMHTLLVGVPYLDGARTTATLAASNLDALGWEMARMEPPQITIRHADVGLW